MAISCAKNWEVLSRAAVVSRTLSIVFKTIGCSICGIWRRLFRCRNHAKQWSRIKFVTSSPISSHFKRFAFGHTTTLKIEYSQLSFIRDSNWTIYANRVATRHRGIAKYANRRLNAFATKKSRRQQSKNASKRRVTNWIICGVNMWRWESRAIRSRIELWFPNRIL